MKDVIEQYLKRNGFRTFCPKAVLFDMDGVIYDSMPNHARSWHEAMQRFGIRMDESEAYQYEGMRGVETIRLKAREQWQREITDQEASSMYEAKTCLFSSCPPAPKMAGIEPLMRCIKGSGMKIGVVTGSGQHSLLSHLEQEFPGLLHQELIVTSFDVRQGKPNPEPYLAGLKKCGVRPWEAIVIENAPLGVRAAVAAQIFTIAVNTGPLPNQQLEAEGAHLIFKTLADVKALWEPLMEISPVTVRQSQHTKWMSQYQTVMEYIGQQKHNPSKHKPEEKKMVNWIKYNKKCLAAGTLPDERKEMFVNLLATMKDHRHINQYV